MSQKGEYLVLVQDLKDIGDRHMTVLPNHLELLKLDSLDFWSLSGFSIDEHGRQGPPNITGSAFIARAATIAEVEARIKKDPFWTEGVWDTTSLTITPFVCTQRSAL